ncbi:MAG: mechanosensitive ion channel family protein [Bacteroidales bacterium]|nr:mechanosensitive ion channel family protein [Bacteroidales bacterium]
MNQVTTLEFWNSVLEKLIQWSITELPPILILIVATIVILKIFRAFIKRLKKVFTKRLERKEVIESEESGKRVETLMNIVYGTGKVIIYVIFIMILLKKLGLDIAPLLAGAGILGLAIGFGSQELVRDFLSGFFILLENQIRKGDVAIIDGTGGLVEAIELRTITLRDFTGTTHIFPNGKINTISNMTMEWSAMVFDIGVAYKEDPEQVISIMKQVGEDLANDPDFKDLIIAPLEVFGVDKFADSAVIIKARIKTKPIQQWTVGREYKKRLKYAFDNNGIEIPFPHTTVYWGEEINPLKLQIEKELKGDSQ